MKLPILSNQLTESPTIGSPLNRRSFLRSAGAVAALVPLAGMMGSVGALGDVQSTAPVTTPPDGPRDVTNQQDIEVLNFALNLEYLEAEYYYYATTGKGLGQSGVGINTVGYGNYGGVTVKSNPKVEFTDSTLQQIATEITKDEGNHVAFLRRILGNNAVAQPKIDLLNSFNTLAQAAGLGASFDPFANEINFFLGAFIFEDVGVTAYHGGATVISDKNVLAYAAGILGVESYHAASIRTILTYIDKQDPSLGIAGIVQKISNLRDILDGPVDNDQGIILNGQINLVPTNESSIVFARTPRQVLNIVYGAPNATKGLFFPDGVNETPLVFP